MGVRFACPACKHRLNVKSELAGRRGRCPQCGTRFRVPIADQPVAAPLGSSDISSSATIIEEGSGSANASQSASPSGTDQAVRATRAPAAAGAPPAAPAGPPSPSAAAAGPTPPSDPFAAAPDASWYVRPQTGGQYGPADSKTMRQWLAEHRIGPHSLVWRDGWAAWRPAADVFAELAQVPSEASAPAVVPQVSEPAADRPNVGKAKYRRVQKQTTIVAILVGVAVLLVIALVVAIMWPRGTGVQASRYGPRAEPLHSLSERRGQDFGGAARREPASWPRIHLRLPVDRGRVVGLT